LSKAGPAGSRLVGWLPLEKGDCEPERQSDVRQRARLRWADLQGGSQGLRPAQGPETGIPLGSMTAAIKKLTELGRITANPEGGLKLAAAQPQIQPASPTPQGA